MGYQEDFRKKQRELDNFIQKFEKVDDVPAWRRDWYEKQMKKKPKDMFK